MNFNRLNYSCSSSAKCSAVLGSMGHTLKDNMCTPDYVVLYGEFLSI